MIDEKLREETRSYEQILYTNERILTPGLIAFLEQYEMEFPPLSEELTTLSRECLRQQVEFAHSGLPLAPDAEEFMATDIYGRESLRDGSVAHKPLAVGLITDTLNQPDGYRNLIPVYKNFKPIEQIEEAYLKAVGYIKQIKHEVEELRTQNPDLFAAEVTTIDSNLLPQVQRLAIYDLHYQNLQEITRVLGMYLTMVSGSVHPKSLAEAERTAVLDKAISLDIDSDPKNLHLFNPLASEYATQTRVGAEALASEIYGKLTPELFRETVYKFLAARRGQSVGQLDQKEVIIEGLLQDLNMTEIETNERLAWEEQIAMLSRAKEQQAINEQVLRGHQFVAAWRKAVGALGEVKSGNISAAVENIKALKINIADFAKAFRLAKETYIKGRVAQANAEEFRSLFAVDGVETLSDLPTAVMDFFARPDVSRVKEFMKGSGLSFDEVLSLLSFTDQDLEAYQQNISEIPAQPSIDEKLAEGIDGFAFADFAQKMLTKLGIAAEVHLETDSFAADLNKVNIVLTDKTRASASAANMQLNLPLSTYRTKLNAIELFAHEVLAHLVCAIRVQDIAPNLSICANSSPSNEGLAVALQTIFVEFMNSPEVELDVSRPGLIDDLYIRAKERNFGAPLALSGKAGKRLPVDAGSMHIITLGLLQGLDRNNQPRTPLEVYDILKKISLVESLITKPSTAEQTAAETAWGNLLRAIRGLWSQDLNQLTSSTSKNLAYQVGATVVRDVLESGDSIASLVIGKVSRANKIHQKAFGLLNPNLNLPGSVIRKSDIFESLGIINNA